MFWQGSKSDNDLLLFFPSTSCNFTLRILSLPSRMWETLAEHSKTCVLSEMLYVYYPEDSVGVVFNNIYEFSGLISGKQYYPADSLSDNQKVCVESS
ncbi:hypothetical protein Bca52824_096922 [Brassica carinata]|uniref:Calmodulin binding protein C-terminal domain-containing protein n=1 Tax=Brassica carinata TaxID=52824 RepID=A0A8X7TGK5_BRACI|nr:hypothetical protein Bca52824_096922 [Brassica carinata]